MLLGALLDGDLLAQMLEERYVSEQRHPVEPLAILNYTQRTQFDRVWNPVTRQCRGLIYNVETGEVVARPWPKFFNFGEAANGEQIDGEVDYDAPVIVTDKLDGSLGILYREPGSGEYAIATRGSFTSEQAIHATFRLRDLYDGWLVGAETYPLEDVTYLFEIVFRENRIVVDYGDLDDLVFLGALDIETHAPSSPRFWFGPRAEEFAYRTLGEALEAEPRPNAEGLVVYFAETGARVKLKQDDYVRLHRIVTGLNERTVWEHLRDEQPIEDLLEPLPEEFRPWVLDVHNRLVRHAYEIGRDAMKLYDQIVSDLGGSIESIATERRREFAEHACAFPESRAYLFMLLDGKAIGAAIWKTLRPSHPRTLVDVAEAVA